MGYFDFCYQEVCVPTVDFSLSESDATGLRIARVTCPAGTDWDRFLVEAGDEIDSYDVVIMRYPTSILGIPELIQRTWQNAWVADTLMYLSLDTRTCEKPLGPFKLHTREQAPLDFSALTQESFDGYVNHYLSNPLLNQIHIPQAYENWANRLAEDPSIKAYVLKSGHDAPAALAVLDQSPEGHNELILAAVHPDYRRKGVLGTMIHQLAELALKQGKWELITSTQVANIGSLRAYGRSGFLPVLAVNTMHIMPRGLADSSVS